MGHGVRVLLALIAFGAPALSWAQTEPPVALKPSASLLETLPEAAQGSVPSFVSGERLHGQTDGVVVIEGDAELRRHDTVLRAELLSQAFGHPLRRIEHAGRAVFLPD